MRVLIKCFLALAIGYAILMLFLNVVFSTLTLQSGVDNSVFFYEKAILRKFFKTRIPKSRTADRTVFHAFHKFPFNIGKQYCYTG